MSGLKTEAPVSPCVSICALDGDDVCVGCFRTGREISYWGRLDAGRQHEVLARCRQRMAGEASPCLLEEASPCLLEEASPSSLEGRSGTVRSQAENNR